MYIRLVKLSGNVEKIPGPKSYSIQNLTICRWNLNSIEAHNFIKIALLKSSTPTDDNNLKMPGYSSVRAEHPSNAKLGGVIV